MGLGIVITEWGDPDSVKQMSNVAHSPSYVYASFESLDMYI